MDKREKYMSYVINDLVRNTEIDYEQQKITFPFLLLPLILIPFPPFSSFLFFAKYMQEMYGVPERMVNDIWDQYKNIIKDRVNG